MYCTTSMSCTPRSITTPTSRILDGSEDTLLVDAVISSPHSPVWMPCFANDTAGLNLSVNPPARTTLLCFASWSRPASDLELPVMGFSRRTCFPARMASEAILSCVEVGVTTTTASTSPFSMS
jgi:hypothetical protein